ncbi:MAG: hypothetical protein ACLP9L_41660 [Thermoguttaceae bacterium]
MGRPATMSEKRKPDRRKNKPGHYRTRKEGRWWNYVAWSREEALKMFHAELAKKEADDCDCKYLLEANGMVAYWEALTAYGTLGSEVARTINGNEELRFLMEEGSLFTPEQWADKVVREHPPEAAPEPAEEEVYSRTVNQAMERFLERQRKRVMRGQNGKVKGSITPARYDVIDRCVRHYVQFLGPSTSIKKLENGDSLETYSDHLAAIVFEEKRWSGAYADAYMVVARQFCHWCYIVDITEREPRNLHDAELAIPKPNREIEPFTVEEIGTVLGAFGERLRLACLLMLNCGYTQADVSNIEPSQVDWELGTITRKRSKTEDKGSVPTVEYPLWKETFTLLKKYGSRDGSRVLTNRGGKPLLANELVMAGKGKYKGEWHNKKIDNLAVNFRRKIAQLIKDKKITKVKSLKVFRKTSNSALQNNRDFAHFAEWFLGQSGRTINKIHYTAYNKKTFADAVAWLHSYYFGSPESKANGESVDVASPSVPKSKST